MPGNDSLAVLRQAAAGVTYPSETDAPWTAFAWPDATGAPTGPEVRRRAGQKPAARVQEQSLDDLFAPLVQEQDWYGDAETAEAAKNKTLRDAIKGTLTNIRVFRVGGRKVAVFVVGQAREGGWAGLKTTAVET